MQSPQRRSLVALPGLFVVFAAGLGCSSSSDPDAAKEACDAGGRCASSDNDSGASVGDSAAPRSDAGSEAPRCELDVPGAGLHVAPEGAPAGAGTPDAPLDLTTVLEGGVAKPGDTIFLHGGVYAGTFTSSLEGTAESPIIVRSYPGEWAVLDAAGGNEPTLTVNGSWTVFRDFEITDSQPPAPTSGSPSPGTGVNCFAPGTKLINLVIHDIGGQGIGSWLKCSDAEIYGNLLFYNGRSHNLDHGIYTQNGDGKKRIVDNVFFANYAWNIACYGTENAELRNFEIEGNVVFRPGLGGSGGNLTLGGGARTEDNLVKDNVFYDDVSAGTGVRFGYGGEPTGLTSHGNVFAGGSPGIRVNDFANVAMQNNRFVSSGAAFVVFESPGTLSSYVWDHNDYRAAPPKPFQLDGVALDFEQWRDATGFDLSGTLSAADPSGVEVRIRPNAYEPGRALVIVLNWDHLDEVAVDLGAVLTKGVSFEVRSALDYLAGPILEGSFDGSAITLPMTGNSVADPHGLAAPPTTEPELNVFIVRQTPPCAPTY